MDVSEAAGRQAPPPTPRVKQLEIHDRKSKTKTAGQLREEAGPCSDHIFLVPEVGRPPRPHRHSKGSLEAKRESCQGMLFPDTFRVGSILAKRRVHTHGRILICTKYGL